MDHQSYRRKTGGCHDVHRCMCRAVPAPFTKKAANDTTALLRAAEQLAVHGSCELMDLEVQSGGEFRRLAASLRRIHQVGLRPAAAPAPQIQMQEPDAQEFIALILRTRALIRTLEQTVAESEEEANIIPGAVLQHLVMAKHEALGLEKASGELDSAGMSMGTGRRLLLRICYTVFLI
ncbi:hypothetical protein ACFTAO_42535 [Paenibacillus rhizoplanae]